ncbi:hypothetical protein BpHYR1_046176 [Brachionus plicatilis]|uniref:Uncharacterized protein n=1 Tax=Brachionus plicatilis TaxID=10195 RepID=A0A3M7R4X8_BRAPC|nr:hypothetical protein BpHYR1_046176 [Brachionus plicatilis]
MILYESCGNNDLIKVLSSEYLKKIFYHNTLLISAASKCDFLDTAQSIHFIYREEGKCISGNTIRCEAVKFDNLVHGAPKLKFFKLKCCIEIQVGRNPENRLYIHTYILPKIGALGYQQGTTF